MTFTKVIFFGEIMSNYNEVTIQFENAIYKVLQERSNITTSFIEHLNFKKN